MSERKELFVPPHSIEAERSVLGAILRDPEQYHAVLDKIRLKSEHFFSDVHKNLFFAMEALEKESKPIDLITVAERIATIPEAKDQLSPAYLVELTENCPVTENAEYYAEIVINKYFLRRIARTCSDTIKRASGSEGTIAQFIEQIEQELLQIGNEQDVSDGLVSVKDILVPTLEELEDRISLEGSVTGVSTGFFDLDNMTSGWQKSDLIIMAARPGMGKTALGLNWALNAVKTGKTVAIFTLEMSKQQLIERLLSAEGRIDSTKLRKGDLDDDDQDRLMHAARALNKCGNNLVIDETPGISVSELRSRCRRYQKEHGLDFIVIDYLQLMSGSLQAQKQGREREIGEISMGLKSLAKELGVPVVAMAQLNRGPDARPDKRPKISDLRESGSMEQDADLIVFVYRDDYYNPNSEFAGKAEILIAKNRHGETGSVYLAWLPNFVSFHNLVKE